MFEKFSERARQVVVLAQQEARTLRHNYIGTEHLLLGLVREEEGLAGEVLRSFEFTTERVRAQVTQLGGVGKDAHSGQIPFTLRAKKVLEMAHKEMDAWGHDCIRTEHELLALLHEGEAAQQSEGVNASIPLQVLQKFGTDAGTIQDALTRRMGIRPLDPLNKSLAERYLDLITRNIQEGLETVAPGVELGLTFSMTIILPSDLDTDTDADLKVKTAVRELVRSRGWEDKLSQVGWIEIS